MAIKIPFIGCNIGKMYCNWYLSVIYWRIKCLSCFTSASDTNRLTSKETGQFKFRKDFVLLESAIMRLEISACQISAKIRNKAFPLQNIQTTVLSQTRPVSERGQVYHERSQHHHNTSRLNRETRKDVSMMSYRICITAQWNRCNKLPCEFTQ